jgi:type I restriction enzyme M protein
MSPRIARAGSSRRLASPQSVNAAVKSICDIMRRSNCAGALQYVPELAWILFLRIRDEREAKEAEQAEAVGAEFRPSLEAPYRWRDWAAPDGPKRIELQNGALGALFGFVNGELLPYLKRLRPGRALVPARRSSARSCPASSERGSTPSTTSLT